jgi:long-chain acyl-CoA synthetase
VATYAQWAQRCAHLAQQFEDAGLQPGERIAIFMHNHPRYLEVLFGAWWAGLAVVPINAKLHVREAQWIVDNAQTSWAFVSADVTTDTGEQLQGLQRVIDVDSQEANDLWAFPKPSQSRPSQNVSRTILHGSFTPAARPAVPRA